MAKKFSAANLPVKKVFDISGLEKERDKLYVSGDDPERLAEIIKRLNYFYYGEK